MDILEAEASGLKLVLGFWHQINTINIVLVVSNVFEICISRYFNQ